MTTPHEAVPKTKSSSLWRRIAGSLIVGVLFFGLLWYTVFSAVTAALIGSGATVVLVAASSWSDIFEQVLETIASVFAAILSAIAAVFSGLFGLFGW